MHEPINWVSASYESIQGTIRSDWKVVDGQFLLSVTVPANTTATVYLPTGEAASITEGGQSIDDHQHVKLIRSGSDFAVLAVASGDYEFVAVSGIKPAKVGLETSTPQDK